MVARYSNGPETETERLDRNWESLLREIRVLQTSVQLLTGFLLILPFQASFDGLPISMRVVYLVTAAAAVGGTLLLAAPVSWHRLLFRRGQMAQIVRVAHRGALAGLWALGAVSAGVATLITYAVLHSELLAGIAGGSVVVLFAVVWLLAPLQKRVTRIEVF